MLAVGEKGLSQLRMVLDDAVEDDRELLVIAGSERVRVLLGDPAVRGPPRVPDADRRPDAVAVELVLEVVELADRPNRLQA